MLQCVCVGGVETDCTRESGGMYGLKSNLTYLPGPFQKAHGLTEYQWHQKYLQK